VSWAVELLPAAWGGRDSSAPESLEQLETEPVYEELDGIVVVVNDDCDLLKVDARRQSSRPDDSAAVRCCLVADPATRRLLLL
jgi:hypothetical protein